MELMVVCWCGVVGRSSGGVRRRRWGMVVAMEVVLVG